MADGAFPDRFPHLEPLDRKTPDTLRSLAVSWFTVKWNFPHHDFAPLGLKESFAVGLEWIPRRRKVKLRQPQRREILAGQGNRQGRVSAQMPRAMGGFGRVLQAKSSLPSPAKLPAASAVPLFPEVATQTPPDPGIHLLEKRAHLGKEKVPVHCAGAGARSATGTHQRSCWVLRSNAGSGGIRKLISTFSRTRCGMVPMGRALDWSIRPLEPRCLVLAADHPPTRHPNLRQLFGGKFLDTRIDHTRKLRGLRAAEGSCC